MAAKWHIGLVFEPRQTLTLCGLSNIRYLTHVVDEVTCSNCRFLHESRVTLTSGRPVTPRQRELAVLKREYYGTLTEGRERMGNPHWHTWVRPGGR